MDKIETRPQQTQIVRIFLGMYRGGIMDCLFTLLWPYTNIVWLGVGQGQVITSIVFVEYNYSSIAYFQQRLNSLRPGDAYMRR